MESRLFKECIDALTPGAEILSKKESDAMWVLFKKKLPMVFWGRIDWRKIAQKRLVGSADCVVSALEEILHKSPNDTIYIFWNEASLPVIKASLAAAINSIDDVTCVGSDTWFLNLEGEYVVEFFHEGEIVVGKIPGELSHEGKI